MSAPRYEFLVRDAELLPHRAALQTASPGAVADVAKAVLNIPYESGESASYGGPSGEFYCGGPKPLAVF
ncbi:MAG TPA: hypothetical protein VJT49_05145 [Amycolatopsis sp.]|uniref:hypothetical protein n=1 Tax=Amycolatopsis sp. TaxID=37632 RepID=UPI002B4759B2|nr:hypothetical protein [Amycolatopsis sp.]HKS44493.1 hypothetical protein [Amycolatopsis sp.]